MTWTGLGRQQDTIHGSEALWPGMMAVVMLEGMERTLGMEAVGQDELFACAFDILMALWCLWG